MRIAVISSTLYRAHPDSYGSEIESALLAWGLAKKHKVTLFAPARSLEGNYRHVTIPCTYGEISTHAELHVWKYYHEELKDYDYIIDSSALKLVTEKIWFYRRGWLKDMVLVWVSNGGFFNPRIPVIWHVHGTVLSNYHKQVGVRAGVPEDKLHVIPYGIRLDWYRPSKNPSRDYVLYLGGPRRDKGIYTILRIADKLPDERFVFAWKVFSKTHEEEAEKFYKEMKNHPNCEHVEYDTLEEKVKLYQNAKCLLKPDEPDYGEMLGLVSLEAMACGTAVVTAKQAGNLEVVKDGLTGYLCNSIDEYIEAIKKVDEIDPKECRRWVQENFNPTLYARRYEELYEEVLG